MCSIESPQSPLDPRDINLNLELLIQLNEAIKSDVSELLAKNRRVTRCHLCADSAVLCYNIYDEGSSHIPAVDEEVSSNFYNERGFRESDTGSFSDTDSDSLQRRMASVAHVGTQTSPSLSSSSTNLSWASSARSSSPSSSDSESCFSESNQWRAHFPWQAAKCFSTPTLEKTNHIISLEVSKQCRSQSDRHLTEIEAAEACKWLRAAGFPQYAQMYEDMQFPIDVATAAQDHPFIESDAIQSLFRRLQILNSCAHIHQQRVTNREESDDEYCALSDNWTYQSDIRRWSRTCSQISCHLSLQASGNRLANQETDDCFSKSTHSPNKDRQDRFKRAGSSKFRRRREGVFFHENDFPLANSEATPFQSPLKYQRRSRTKSFDKTETLLPAPSPVCVVWHRSTRGEEPTTLEEKENIEPVVSNSGLDLCQLTCTQLQMLRKLALLKLTAHMEKYCPSHRTGWNWDLPKFIRKIKSPVAKDKGVFGVPLSATLQKTGQALPKSIEEALDWLQQNAVDQVGIFRKPGVKSRIQALRHMIESSDRSGVDFINQQSYDVADVVKQYFRDLPETLLTNKLSETFILIFQYVPGNLRYESVLCAILLMPDEHTEVLRALLHFLLQVAKHSNVNQMSESNLAMCFAPSLFSYSQAYKQTATGSPHPKELAENKAAHDCLCYFLNYFDSLFKIPPEFMKQCKNNDVKEPEPKLLKELGSQKGGWLEYLEKCQVNLIREAREKQKSWVTVSSHQPKVDIHFKKVADGIPLRLWKVGVDVEAPPTEVLHRLLRERHVWDPELRCAKIVFQLEPRAEVFQYVRGSMASRPAEEYCVVRTWKTNMPRDGCLLVETSVEHPEAAPVPNSVRGLVLASRYLIEPCGSGRSRLVHFSRVDSMGRAPDWYQKHFGHLQALFLANIQNSFSQHSTGPESKV